MVMSNSQFYEVCNLRGNPFRANATLDDDPRMALWAGQTQERGLLEKFLTRSRADQVGNSNLILLYGDWGTGKSHALLWGAQWLRSIKDGKSAAYYIQSLKKDKGRISFGGAFVEDLVARTSLVGDVLEYRQFLRTQLTHMREEKSLDAKIPDEEVIELLIPPGELQTFAKELDRQENEQQIRAFLVPKGLTDYQALVTFTRIVNLFVYELRFANGVRRFRQSVHLMIDELDILRQATTKEILEVNDVIRHLYDSCPNCFGLVLAVSAELELLSSMFADYVLTRVSRQIEFKPFDRATSVDFIIQIMEQFRIDPKNPGRIGSYPFTPQAIDAVAGQVTSRTPRRVVSVMQQVIEEARLAELNPAEAPIDVEALEKSEILDQVL